MIGRSGDPSQLAEGRFWDLGHSATSRVFTRWPRNRAFREIPSGADTWRVKLRPTTLDRIARAFAEAVACGDFAAAEGWLVAARHAADREADRSGVAEPVRG